MRKLIHFLNPIAHLGEKKYPITLPLSLLLIFALLSEFFAYKVANDPDIVGLYAIFIPVALIIYSAFRYGIPGGVAAVVVTIAYYAYIITSRNKPADEQLTQWETTLILAGIYILMAVIIGWLRQTIDDLIEREANGRKRLQTILQQLPVGVVISDNKGRITQSNKKLESIIGMKIPNGVVAGKDMLLKVNQNGKPVSGSQSVMAQALQTGRQVVGREFEVERPDGKVAHIQVSASPIRGRDGRVIAAASIVTDVSVQKEIEKRKDDFVNMASHELKTPITSMMLYVDSLLIQLKKHNDPKAIKTIKNIKYQTDRLKELVSDLLDVSRLQTGKLLFNKEEFRLDGLIRETVEQLQGGMKEGRKIVYNSRLPVKISGDKFRIYQVLTNLITNADKYSPEPTDIIISLKKQDGKAIVGVKDRGIGIPRDQLKKVFDRLYQVTGDKEKTFPGLGMGLYISKEIIKRHHGNIWVESEQGKGSVFYFSLPAD